MDPLSLIKYDLTFTDVMQVIEANNRQVGGQYVNLGSEQYLVRGLGLVANERDIGDMVVKVEDGNARLPAKYRKNPTGRRIAIRRRDP